MIEPKRIEFSGSNITRPIQPSEKGQKTIDECIKKNSNQIIDIATDDDDIPSTKSKAKQVVSRNIQLRARRLISDDTSDIQVGEEYEAIGESSAMGRKRALNIMEDDEEVEVEILKKRKKGVPGKLTKPSKDKIQYEDLLRRNKKVLDQLSVQIRENEGIPVTPRKNGEEYIPATPKFRMTKKFRSGEGNVEFEAKVKPPVSFFRAFKPPDDLDMESLHWNGTPLPGVEDGLGVDDLKPFPDLAWTSCRHIWNAVSTKLDGLMNEMISLFPDTIIISYISNR